MKDMAEKISPMPEKEKYYPSMSLGKEDIGDREVGEEGTMLVKYKIVSVDISMGQKTRYRLEMRKFEIKDDEDED